MILQAEYCNADRTKILRVTFSVILSIMLSGLRRLQKKSLDLYLRDRSNDLFLLFLKLSFAKKCLITKQLRRRRQRQRQKTIGIMSKNDSSARASCSDHAF